ncbi:AtuA-related protein [Salsuginibacillus kocurii]|uniref:AtuA-related protein n=1 Tax=Salsuginibacillus kocurii TaxID=427078 RepID=UPI00035E2EB9|nr:hypothetical protein [Salsuginibacillus kocurii]
MKNKKIKLYEIAHSRAGDKGNILNLSLIPYQDSHYAWLLQEVTEENVKQHLAHLITGKVTRYKLPNLHALNFVCDSSLGGGVTTSLRIDAHGKSLSSALLEMEIPPPITMKK